MPPLSVLGRAYGDQAGYSGGTPDLRAGTPADDWFAANPYAPTAPAGGAPGGGGDASWWNPQDPQGSIQRLFGGQPPSSQTILAHAPQLRAAGIEISPPNAEGVTSKIHIPGVGWTRILEGGVAGGQGTGWNYVPQGVTGPGGTIPIGGGGVPDQLAQLRQSPGYQFRLGEGVKALERSAAARGTLLTGGTLKGLERYAQDYASGEYGNRVNQLTNLSEIGLRAAGGAGSAASGYGQSGGDLLTQQGNAQAAGTIGGANAYRDAINNTAKTAMETWFLSRMYPGMFGGGGGGTGAG